ncbi:hypothetical protein TCAL_16948 [Tigriopus californicus]|uniref:Uncharacterized protein n=1 Tax=Tigriopus californicus TaxID=6832 RepID=A0A553NQX2_TIGCA|nr:hypothetical protein TCAL_16948 [Tigriopus californicus]
MGHHGREAPSSPQPGRHVQQTGCRPSLLDRPVHLANGQFHGERKSAQIHLAISPGSRPLKSLISQDGRSSGQPWAQGSDRESGGASIPCSGGYANELNPMDEAVNNYIEVDLTRSDGQEMLSDQKSKY